MLSFPLFLCADQPTEIANANSGSSDFTSRTRLYSSLCRFWKASPWWKRCTCKCKFPTTQLVRNCHRLHVILSNGKRASSFLFLDSSNQEEEVEEAKTILSILILKQIKNTLESSLLERSWSTLIWSRFFFHIFAVEKTCKWVKNRANLE